jgi:hypothetical protein
VLETTETTMGRPPKQPGEKTETVSIRVGASLFDYLKGGTASAGPKAFSVLKFERELTFLLDSLLVELRISAAAHGQSYELNRAETIARLVMLGLQQEKSPAAKTFLDEMRRGIALGMEKKTKK